MKLTEEQILKQGHIPTDEIVQDMGETLQEVEDMEAEFAILSKNRPANKVRCYMLESGIRERKDFAESLQCVLDYRAKVAI